MKIAPMLANFAFALGILVALFVLRTLSVCSLWWKKVYNSFYYSVFWNIPLRVFLEGFLPVSKQQFEQLKEGYEWNSVLHIT